MGPPHEPSADTSEAMEAAQRAKPVLRRRRRGGRSPLAVWLAGLSPGTVRTANAQRAFCYLAVCSYETAVGEDAVVSTTSELSEHGRDDAVP